MTSFIYQKNKVDNVKLIQFTCQNINCSLSKHIRTKLQILICHGLSQTALLQYLFHQNTINLSIQNIFSEQKVLISWTNFRPY